MLLSNFDLLAATPDGVARLRELILTLAVQGKLVAQDARDEPASELLQKIHEETKQLIKEKKIRQSRPLKSVDKRHYSFDLPESWEWECLGNLGDWGAGTTPMRSNASYFGGPIPWFKSGELTADFISKSEETVTESALRECSLRLNKIGDVLVAMYGATIGKTSILSVVGTTNQAVCACTPFKGLKNDYLLLLLKALKPYFISIGTGGAQPNISREKIISTVVGLPPLAEQTRIVARVQELMRLCDALEAKGRLEAAHHNQLVTTLLSTLIDTTSPEALADRWQRIAEHFDSLLDRPEAVDVLEQAILQLATSGQLSERQSSDYEALVLPVSDAVVDAPFEIPLGWVWVTLGQLSTLVTSGSRSWKDFYAAEGSTFIRSQDIKYDRLEFDNRAFVKLPRTAEGMRTQVQTRDLLITITGANVGKTAVILDRIDEAYVSQHVALVRLRDMRVADYLHLWLINGLGGRLALLGSSYGAKPGLNLKNVRNLVVPLPPLSEQSRIVTRVKELRRLCADLRENLKKQKCTKIQLGKSLID